MGTIIASYWMEILLSIVSIVVGFIVGYVFYRLQKRDVASARAERVKRAREELLDVLEGYIINKQRVSEESIRNLLAASEREYQVELRDICNPTILLQDVALRLQKSRHLDIAQKREYADQIEQMISSSEERRKEIPEEVKEPLELATVIESAIKNDEREKALETINLLKRNLIKPPVPARAEYASIERWQLIASLIAGVGTVLATLALALGTDFSGLFRDVGIDLAVGFMVVVFMAVAMLVRRWLEEGEKG